MGQLPLIVGDKRELRVDKHMGVRGQRRGPEGEDKRGKLSDHRGVIQVLDRGRNCAGGGSARFHSARFIHPCDG